MVMVTASLAAPARLDRLRVECTRVVAPTPDQMPAVSGILAHVAAGDAAAVREAVSRFGGMIWGMARRFEGEDAEDAVQEIFIDLWKNAGRYDPNIAKETTFVLMLARRRLIDRRRRRGLRSTTAIELVPAIVDSTPPPDVATEAALAARAVEALGADQRNALLLSICHGLSHSEIATRLSMPLGTVKAHLRRGLIAVRAATLGASSEEVPDGT